jgi:high-affinity Fe2+/Pb2+ permease
MRIGILGPYIFTAVFLGWVLYRTFIKKDIKKYKNEVFGGFFFIAVWVILYFVIL